MIRTAPNIPGFESPDETYADLIAAHEGLSREESEALNARLILVLCAQIGARDDIREAIATAKAGGSDVPND